MFFFDVYARQGCWMTVLLSVAAVVIAVITLYSVLHYKKPRKASGEMDEHAEPGIPLVLKMLYLGFAIWLIAVTYIVASWGIRI